LLEILEMFAYASEGLPKCDFEARATCIGEPLGFWVNLDFAVTRHLEPHVAQVALYINGCTILKFDDTESIGELQTAIDLLLCNWPDEPTVHVLATRVGRATAEYETFHEAIIGGRPIAVVDREHWTAGRHGILPRGDLQTLLSVARRGSDHGLRCALADRVNKKARAA
jgi:hypothetical protein